MSNLGPDNVEAYGAKLATEAVLPIVQLVIDRRDGEHSKFLNASRQYPW